MSRHEAQSGSSPPVEKRYDPRDSRLNFVDIKDEFDFHCEGFPSPRAMMCCGHVVTPMSLTKWCLRQLKEGKSRFACVFCKEEWTYEEVCRMALLTPEEKEHFEETMALNDAKTRKCPDCQSFVVRQNESDLCVLCIICTFTKKEIHEFCWQCLREWKGPKPRLDRCGNDDCCDPVLETLLSCPDMPFEWRGVTGCPSIRACPTCGSLLQHSGRGCPNIRCTKCKVQFCFMCLKTTAEHWRTGNSCVVAPRQTSISVWKK